MDYIPRIVRHLERPLYMAQDHGQKSAKGQKPDLNAIQPGMEVEDTARELGENDVSKPLVIDVIRDKHGQVQYVLISKGLLFKKQVLVSVGRIKEVKLDLEDKKSPGKVVIETSPEDELLLEERGLDILSEEERGDIFADTRVSPSNPGRPRVSTSC